MAADNGLMGVFYSQPFRGGLSLPDFNFEMRRGFPALNQGAGIGFIL